MAPVTTQTKSISQRLLATTLELQELEKLVVSGDFSPRVLSDFRSAVDNIRCTTWTVQQWIGLQQQSQDPYSVLSALSSERVRRATQIAKDLTLDLQTLEIGYETAGLTELFSAVEGLRDALAPLFRK
jgi:phosphoribosylpyrophosphate synthetase